MLMLLGSLTAHSDHYGFCQTESRSGEWRGGAERGGEGVGGVVVVDWWGVQRGWRVGAPGRLGQVSGQVLVLH